MGGAPAQVILRCVLSEKKFSMSESEAMINTSLIKSQLLVIHEALHSFRPTPHNTK